MDYETRLPRFKYHWLSDSCKSQLSHLKIISNTFWSLHKVMKRIIISNLSEVACASCYIAIYWIKVDWLPFSPLWQGIWSKNLRKEGSMLAHSLRGYSPLRWLSHKGESVSQLFTQSAIRHQKEECWCSTFPLLFVLGAAYGKCTNHILGGSFPTQLNFSGNTHKHTQKCSSLIQ